MLKIKFLRLIVALGLVIGITGSSIATVLADSYLCGPSTSYTTCTGSGYTDHGYGGNNGTSYWHADSGHNCTNYVAYVEIQNGFSSQNTYSPGNASNWNSYFSNLGFTVNSSPAVGAVAWWNSSFGGGLGHVAYVESYNASSITVSEDDALNGKFDWQTINSGSSNWPSGFIHLKDIAGYETAFQASGTDELYFFGDKGTGPVSGGYAVASGTSPSITSYSSNSYEAAFRDSSSGDLRVVGGDWNGDTGDGIASGTSPSITTLGNGGLEVAYVATNGELYLYGDAGSGAASGPVYVASGTSPSITKYGSSSYEVAFRDSSSGDLRVVGGDWNGDTGDGIASGTSPSITTLTSGGLEATFQAAGTNELYLYGDAGSGAASGPVYVASGTSPSITKYGSSSYEVAFRDSSSGDLRVVGGDWNGDTGDGIASGTSPSITTLTSGGLEATFQAAGTNDLYLYGDADTGTTAYGVDSSSSPSIE